MDAERTKEVVEDKHLNKLAQEQQRLPAVRAEANAIEGASMGVCEGAERAGASILRGAGTLSR